MLRPSYEGLLFYKRVKKMDEKLVKIEELTNDELVKLYQDILQHIKFLNDSIINESDDKNE
jgi:hypothetical protein